MEQAKLPMPIFCFRILNIANQIKFILNNAHSMCGINWKSGYNQSNGITYRIAVWSDQIQGGQ